MTLSTPQPRTTHPARSRLRREPRGGPSSASFHEISVTHFDRDLKRTGVAVRYREGFRGQRGQARMSNGPAIVIPKGPCNVPWRGNYRTLKPLSADKDSVHPPVPMIYETTSLLRLV